MKLTEPGVHRRAEFYFQQLDALRSLRQQVRRELLRKARNTRPGNGSARFLRSVRSERAVFARHPADPASVSHQAAAM